MHVPRRRHIERSRWFRALQGHHRMHHVYYYRNLNVVLPIADWVLGTKLHTEPELFETIENVRLRRSERKERAHAHQD
jgi:sterol desaturase/sphingolipid hydroxylase (fatty acid hydroxylase superfamily)